MRWTAYVRYNTPRETDILHVEELEELQDKIEAGPNWYEIKSITLKLTRSDLVAGLIAWEESR